MNGTRRPASRLAAYPLTTLSFDPDSLVGTASASNWHSDTARPLAGRHGRAAGRLEYFGAKHR